MSLQLRARAEDLHWQLVDDEVVILDLRTSRYLSLNPAGARLWPLLVAGTTRERLAQALVDGHGIGLDRAHRDVDRLVDQLAGAGVLRPSAG